jgi:hypothetical protein
MPEIVYILQNDAMPGLVMVGLTTTSVEARMRQLDTTSVPLPFRCFFAAEVANAAKVEERIHEAFGDQRVRDKREFFRMAPHRIKAILDLVMIKDVTPGQEVETESGDAAALARNEGRADRAARLKFSMLGIKPGDTLKFVRKESITCTVVDDSTVSLDDEILSLTNATLKALAKTGVSWKSAQGSNYWMFGDLTLQELRDEQDAS